MKVARLAGVDVRINEWLVLLSAIYVWAGVGTQVALAFLCVAWHEFGHILVAYRQGFIVREIEFFPFGGVARLGTSVQQRPRDEIFVALAGPAFSFALVLILEAGLLLGLSWNESLDFLRNVNFTLGIFNLLPILPLDGGRVLRAMLTSKLGAMKASQTSAEWGEGMALVFGLLAVLGLYWQQTGLDLPLIAGFLFLGAHRERRMGPMVFWGFIKGKRRQLTTRAAWNGEVVVARQDVRISSLLPRVAPEQCLVVTVIDAGGRIIGQIGEGELLGQIVQGKEDVAIGELIRKT